MFGESCRRTSAARPTANRALLFLDGIVGSEPRIGTGDPVTVQPDRGHPPPQRAEDVVLPGIATTITLSGATPSPARAYRRGRLRRPHLRNRQEVQFAGTDVEPLELAPLPRRRAVGDDPNLHPSPQGIEQLGNARGTKRAFDCCSRAYAAAASATTVSSGCSP